MVVLWPVIISHQWKLVFLVTNNLCLNDLNVSVNFQLMYPLLHCMELSA